MKLNTILRKLNTCLNDPKVIPLKFVYKLSPMIKDDKFYLKILFPLKTGYILNLNKPVTYNEKMQWLKINYRHEIMHTMVDKYEVKNFAKEIIGEEYIVPTYGVWDSFEEINFNDLPRSFVLKTTHDQGGVVVIKDKYSMDFQKIKNKIEEHLKTNHYLISREWPYKGVKPRIMAEALLENESLNDLYDYKFYCFHGVPKIMYIAHGRNKETCYFDFYDMNFQKLDIERPRYPKSDIKFDIPKNWDLMINLSIQLSKDFPHLRVDFYNINGKIYLGELTFFQGGGLMPFIPQSWDEKMGDFLNIENLK